MHVAEGGHLLFFIGFIAKHPCLVADRYSRSPIGMSHYHSFDKRRPNQTNGLDALHTGHV